jgi:hypothetical protein
MLKKKSNIQKSVKKFTWYLKDPSIPTIELGVPQLSSITSPASTQH